MMWGGLGWFAAMRAIGSIKLALAGAAVLSASAVGYYLAAVLEDRGALGSEKQTLQASLDEAVRQNRIQRNQIQHLNEKMNQANRALRATRLDAERHKQTLKALPEAGKGITCEVDSLYPSY